MASAYTTNRNIEQPANGDDVDTWNVPVNADWAIIDACFGDVVTVTLAASPVTLTTTQLQCFRLSFIGTLTANVVVSIPAGVGGIFEVSNSTTGAYTVTLNNLNAGASVLIPQGILFQISCDGTNVTPSAMAPPVGSLLITAASTADVGYMLCYGQAVSRTVYAALFAVISTNYGVGDGSTTFNLPDMRGRMPAGLDNMGGTPANRITVAGGNFDGTVLGNSGGQQNNVVGQANLASFDFTADIAGHLPQTDATFNVASLNIEGGPNNFDLLQEAVGNITNASVFIAQTNIDITNQNVPSGGSSIPLPTLSNAQIFCYEIKY